MGNSAYGIVEGLKGSARIHGREREIGEEGSETENVNGMREKRGVGLGEKGEERREEINEFQLQCLSL